MAAAPGSPRAVPGDGCIQSLGVVAQGCAPSEAPGKGRPLGLFVGRAALNPAGTKLGSILPRIPEGAMSCVPFRFSLSAEFLPPALWGGPASSVHVTAPVGRRP